MKPKNILSLLLVLLFMSCQTEPEKLLVGKWRGERPINADPGLFYPTGLEFFEDGTLSWKGFSPARQMDISAAGNFKLIDAQHMKLDVPGFLSNVVEVSVSRNTLVLTFPGGEVRNFERE